MIKALMKCSISSSMIKFADFFKQSLSEAKFRPVSIDVEEIAKKCVDLYFEKYHNKTEKQLKNITVPTTPGWRRYFRGQKIKRLSVPEILQVTDLETNKAKPIKFIVAFGEHEGAIGFYDQTKETIVLIDQEAKDLTKRSLLSTFVHELTHSIQQYKKQSEEYSREVEKMFRGEDYDPHVYFLEPLELDAHLTALAFDTKKEFSKRLEDISKSREMFTRRMMIKRLEKFLLELKVFITSGSETYFDYEELPIPEFIAKHQEFVETLKEHPKEWRKFKQRLDDLYIELDKEQKKLLAS